MLRQVGITILWLSLWLQGCAGKAELVDADAVTVLRGATLLDGTGAPSKLNAVVVLKGDRAPWLPPKPKSAPRFVDKLSAASTTSRSTWECHLPFFAPQSRRRTVV